MNAEFARRTFLRTSAVAWATGQAAAAGDPYEQAVRDARMEWTALPQDPRLAPHFGNGRLVVRIIAAPNGSGVRLLVGGLYLRPLGTPTALECALDLWDAELTGRITTTRGTVVFSALMDRHSPTLLLRAGTEGGERLSYTAQATDGSAPPLRSVSRAHGDRQLLATSPADVTRTSEGTLRGLLPTGADAAVIRHRAWWYALHRRGYVSLPERTLQRSHRVQMYTLATVTDPGPEPLADAPVLLGPSPHLDIGPVATVLEQSLPAAHAYLAGALPRAGSEAGRTDDPVRASGALAPWEAHRYAAGPRILRDLLCPALAAVFGYYSGCLMEGVDGRVHLPVTHSPGQADVSDSIPVASALGGHDPLDRSRSPRRALLRGGAAGFLLKGTSSRDLATDVRTVAEGSAMLTPRITKRLIDTFAGLESADAARARERLSVLTSREDDVVRAVARGSVEH
ncbi:hypothetical protein ACFY9A_19220 [Streptomyces rubradiris]|uniref:hypothetical protein n=1 Tax=Streptomyces rubradiris TaxID=285531 RepID=UPI0036EDCB8D